MALPPTSLLLSFDSTLQPLLLPSSSPRPPRSSASFLPRRLIRVLSRPPLASTSIPTTVSRAVTAESPSSSTTLREFKRTHNLTHGFLEIRQMNGAELDETVKLLAESFSEAMFGSDRCVPLLIFLVKQYISERLTLVPHMAVLVGLYTEKNSNVSQLACTAEVSFNELGSNAACPTPQPPAGYPYICNMTTKKSLRRKGIALCVLRACEDLILQMKVKTDVYLHCRVVDKGPLAMYTKAGYKVVKTDSIRIWFSLHRRKHLMRKSLPPPKDSQPVIKSKDLPQQNDEKDSQPDIKSKDLPQQNDDQHNTSSSDEEIY